MILRELRAIEDGREAMFTEWMNHPHPLAFPTFVSYLIGDVASAAELDGDLWGMSTPVAQLAADPRLSFRAIAFVVSRTIGTPEQRKAVDRSLAAAPEELPTLVRDLDQARATEVWQGVHPDPSVTTIGMGIRFAQGEEAGVLWELESGEDGHVIDVTPSFTSPAQAAEEWSRAHAGQAPTGASRSDVLPRLRKAHRLSELDSYRDPADAWQQRVALAVWALRMERPMISPC